MNRLLLPLVCLLGFSLIAVGKEPAETNAKVPNIKVGVAIEPPFVIYQDKQWSGISIELWEMVADHLGWHWTYEASDLSELLSKLESGKIDVAVGALDRTAEREKLMDFSPTYINTGLALAAREDPVTGVLDVLSHLGDSAFLQLTISLVIVCILFGMLMWWVEHRDNKDHFGGQMTHGFGSGIWWSMVTMSTVGYGDKAPRTVAGRALGLVWIFLSIVLLAAFTGTIASSMTMDRLGTRLSGIQDLRGLSVGSTKNSEASLWLKQNGITSKEFDSIYFGLADVVNGDIDVFVGNRAAVIWQMARFEKDSQLAVQGNIHPERLAFALPSGSDHLEAMNVAMLKVLESRAWRFLRSQYGEEQILANTLGSR